MTDGLGGGGSGGNNNARPQSSSKPTSQNNQPQRSPQNAPRSTYNPQQRNPRYNNNRYNDYNRYNNDYNRRPNNYRRPDQRDYYRRNYDNRAPSLTPTTAPAPPPAPAAPEAGSSSNTIAQMSGDGGGLTAGLLSMPSSAKQTVVHNKDGSSMIVQERENTNVINGLLD